MIPQGLHAKLDLDRGVIEGGAFASRHLSDLNGSFADQVAYDAMRSQGDPLLYSVSSLEPAHGDGQLHYGLGVLMPGKVGDEYFLTRGHLHTWRVAAEVYIGLRGSGCMLLQDEETGESRLEPLHSQSIVYVPGFTAHRTINTGAEPLIYIGVYPAQAGHDYAPIAKENFRMIVVDRNGTPKLIERQST
jgi:glucose-6-phosphate isomerase, archaeal